MKKIIVSLLLIICGLNTFSQQPKTVKKDTINLRGYIYDADGKPVKYFSIKSRQLDLLYNQGLIYGHTDSLGYFEIKGAKPFDTLTIAQKHIFYPDLPDYYNRGSRYIVIYLPVAKDHFEINASNPIVISHQRIKDKKIPSFKIETQDNYGCFFGDVILPPTFMKMEDRTWYGSREGEITNKKFTDLITSFVTYPTNAIKNNIEGTVKVSFQIPRDGTPMNFKILNGIGYGCDEAVIAAIKKAGTWRPAIDNGRPLIGTEIISVEFKLTDK